MQKMVIIITMNYIYIYTYIYPYISMIYNYDKSLIIHCLDKHIFGRYSHL